MHTEAEVRSLVAAGETQTVEFRVGVPFPDPLARLLASFANAEGGTLILGIREPDVFAGVEQKKFDLFFPRAVQRLQSSLVLNSQSLQIDGKTIIVIDIQKSKTPVATSEGYFFRIGTTEQPITPSQLVARMIEDSGASTALETLSQTVSIQTSEISRMRESFESVNSWKRKVYYALVGAVATQVAKFAWVALGLPAG